MEVSETGVEFLESDNTCTIFVIDDMEGPISETPHHPRFR